MTNTAAMWRGVLRAFVEGVRTAAPDADVRVRLARLGTGSVRASVTFRCPDDRTWVGIVEIDRQAVCTSRLGRAAFMRMSAETLLRDAVERGVVVKKRGVVRVLFVDDSIARLIKLRALVSQGGGIARIAHRRSARAVADGDLGDADLVFLDHDMCEGEPLFSEGSFCPTSGRAECTCPTGLDVARRLAGLVQKGLAAPAVVVQSLKYVGAAKIVDVLRDAKVDVQYAPVTHWPLDPAGARRTWGQFIKGVR